MMDFTKSLGESLASCLCGPFYQKTIDKNKRLLEPYEKWRKQFSEQLINTKSAIEFEKLLNSQNKNGGHMFDTCTVNLIINILSSKVSLANCNNDYYLISIHKLLICCPYNYNEYFINTSSGLKLEDKIFLTLERPLLNKLDKQTTRHEIIKLINLCPKRFTKILNTAINKLIDTCYFELGNITTLSEGMAILNTIMDYNGLQNNEDEYYRIIDTLVPFVEKIEEVQFILNKCNDLNKDYLKNRIIDQLILDDISSKSIEIAYELCDKNSERSTEILEMLNNFHQKTA